MTKLSWLREPPVIAYCTPPLVKAPPQHWPARAAQMLALAHKFQGLIDHGEVEDRAALALHLGFTRAHPTQILDLLLLTPHIQEMI